MAGNDNGNHPNGNDKWDKNQPIDIDVNNNLDVNVDVDNTFSPDIDVNNVNKNYNENNNLNLNLNVNKNENENNNYNTNKNYNFNFVDVDQSQKQNQNQGQFQFQDQNQKQSQSQANVQVVNVDMPKGADGGILISTSNSAPKVSQLDVGEAAGYSRLVYPGEVIAFEIRGGDYVTMRSASDVAMYTIGTYAGDEIRINDVNSMPTYNPVYHRMEFGTVVPVDMIPYFTTKATLTTSESAHYVVIDNRAPRNSYTHVEIGITAMDATFPKKFIEPPTIHLPSVYPTDEYGRAITG